MKSEHLITERVKMKIWSIEVTIPVSYKPGAVHLAQLYYHFEINIINRVYYVYVMPRHFAKAFWGFI